MRYSDHDDRRSPERRTKGGSPDRWKHDLWDSIKNAPPVQKMESGNEEKEEGKKKDASGEAAVIAVGLRVQNMKTKRTGVVSEVEEGSDQFKVKFDDGDEHWRPVVNFEAEDGRSLSYRSDKEKSRKGDEKDDSEEESAPAADKAADKAEDKGDADNGEAKGGEKDEKEEKAASDGK